MKYYLIFVCLIFNLNSESNKYLYPFSECSQNNKHLEKIQDTIVFTPGGLALKSNIHYIDNRHHISIVDDRIQIVESKTGIISQEITRSYSQNGVKHLETYSQQLTDKANLANTDFKDGWTTYAYCSIFEANPEPISSFSTKWIVPQPPEYKSDQLIYIFNGLQTIENDVAYILQPVLQWGKSPAGGGDYWAICNWFVTSNQFFHDSLVQVSSGTSLHGLIKLISKTDSLFNYTSSFVNLTSELKINDSHELVTPYEVLETYNLNNCNQFPSQEKVTMSDINIKTGDYFPEVNWYTFNAEVGCGQFSRVILEYSKNGQVDIYFRTPSTGDFFDVLHVYPNPVRDALSIVSLKEISNCKIEIFRFTGELIQIIPGIDIDFDYVNKHSFYYELNLQNYLPGIYFVRVNYENKSHTFKIIKN